MENFSISDSEVEEHAYNYRLKSSKFEIYMV